MKKVLLRILGSLLVAVAFPIYLVSLLLHFIGRIILAIAYLLRLMPYTAKREIDEAFQINFKGHIKDIL